jgi:hypothetical protein
VFALNVDVLRSLQLIKVSYVTLVDAKQIVELVNKISVQFVVGLKSCMLQRFNKLDGLRTLEVVSIFSIDVMPLFIKEFLIVASESLRSILVKS